MSEYTHHSPESFPWEEHYVKVPDELFDSGIQSLDFRGRLEDKEFEEIFDNPEDDDEDDDDDDWDDEDDDDWDDDEWDEDDDVPF